MLWCGVMSCLKERSDKNSPVCALALNQYDAFFVSGTCVITKSDAADLFTAADLLGLIPLRDAVAKFLEKCIDVRNCLQVSQNLTQMFLF